MNWGSFYIILGLAIILIAVGLAFSRYGSIRLGNTEKPRYSTFSWGAMIFTSTMAADILYWSLIEWCYYYTATPFAMENMTLAQRQDWRLRIRCSTGAQSLGVLHIAGMCLRIYDVCKTESARLCRRHAGQS